MIVQEPVTVIFIFDDIKILTFPQIFFTNFSFKKNEFQLQFFTIYRFYVFF